MPRPLHTSARALLGHFRKDRKGVSAIEFALIAPLMALFYAGSVELASTLLADRKVSSAASTVGDLTARLPVVHTCAMDEIFEVANLIFQPYPTGTLQARVISVQPDTADPTIMEVGWVFDDNWSGATLAAGDTVGDVPAGVMPADGSIIQVDIRYTYSPPFNRVFQTDPLLEDRFYMRPRSVNVIPVSGTC